MTAIEDARALLSNFDRLSDDARNFALPYAQALRALIAEHERLTAAPAALVGKWSVRDTLTGTLYPQPNKLIAQKVAEMHGQSEVVLGWPETTPPTDAEREALVDHALRIASKGVQINDGHTYSVHAHDLVDYAETIRALVLEIRRHGPITDEEADRANQAFHDYVWGPEEPLTKRDLSITRQAWKCALEAARGA